MTSERKLEASKEGFQGAGSGVHLTLISAFEAWCLGLRVKVLRLIDSGWEGTTRAEDAKRTPTQSHISPGTLVYED